MFRKKKPRLSGGSEAEASLYARWIRESIPRAIRLHNAIGSGLSSPAPPKWLDTFQERGTGPNQLTEVSQRELASLESSG